MAMFKVGDKARLVNLNRQPFAQANGNEVIILALPGLPYLGAYQITRPAALLIDADRYFALPHNLVPLTDPGAWATEAVKRVTKPKPEVLTPLETAIECAFAPIWTGVK